MKNRIGSATGLLLPQFRGNFRGDFGVQPGGPVVLLFELVVNFLAVVEVVGQSCIDIGEGDAGEHLDNFFRAATALFMPGDDIEDPDAMPSDAGAATANSRSFGDVLI